MAEQQRSQRKEREGKVLSDRMDKTITVAVERQIKHPIYKKFVNKTSKYMAHDEENSAKEGDIVRIMSTRPLSKHKSWRLAEILEKAK